MARPSQPDTAVMIAARLQAAGQALAQNDLARAEALCREALTLAPFVPEASYMLGVATLQGRDAASAIPHFDRALSRRPDFVQALAQKARAMLELDETTAAIRAADAAAQLAPTDAFTLDTLGNVLTRAGLHARAVPFFARAAELSGQPGYHYNHAHALQTMGAFDEARTAYRACLTRAPGHALAWAGLVQITRQTQTANDIPRLERAFALVDRDPGAAYAIGHALAKAHEDLGDTQTAMVWLARAKVAADRAVPDEAAADIALFEAAMRSASLPPAEGYADAAPIFVLGLPRSGTTLVDRILSSHRDVVSGGELTSFPHALRRAVGDGPGALLDASRIDRAAGVDAAKIGRAYAEEVRQVHGFAGRFVDKLPLNFFLVPHILRALPNARVVVLRREPADVVLSSYRQSFAMGAAHLSYTLDLERAARYVLKFEALMDRFAETAPPDRLFTVRYEDVVADLESQTRRLLAACGLDFDPACLSFHENAAPVATASAAQVRQPLYATSVGRWARYRPAIDPALRILAEAGRLPPELVAEFAVGKI